VVADVPRAIWYPYFGTLQDASETRLRARSDTHRSFPPKKRPGKGMIVTLGQLSVYERQDGCKI
jgi:hypothetical protein